VFVFVGKDEIYLGPEKVGNELMAVTKPDGGDSLIHLGFEPLIHGQLPGFGVINATAAAQNDNPRQFSVQAEQGIHAPNLGQMVGKRQRAFHDQSVKAVGFGGFYRGINHRNLSNQVASSIGCIALRQWVPAKSVDGIGRQLKDLSMRNRVAVVGALALLWALPAFAAGGASGASRVGHVGPGFIVAGSMSAPGVGISGSFNLIKSRRDLYFGIDSGFFVQTAPGVGFLVPAVVMAYERFPMSRTIVPTLGMGMGIVLGFGNGNKLVEFMLLINPGFEFMLTQSVDLFFRTNVGLFGLNVTFYPQVGVAMRI